MLWKGSTKTVVASVSARFYSTPAQSSRAARHAVQLSLRSPIGGTDDALLIVNSLRYSNFKSDPSSHQNFAVKAFQLQLQRQHNDSDASLDFAQPVSPRLASHALLHGLLRMRRNQHAHTLALEMMESGIQLRTKTIKTLIRSFSPLRQSSPPPTPIPLSDLHVNPNQTLADLTLMAQNPSTKLALEIFTVARKSQQRNSNGLLATLIAICLVNAEVVLASLVFAFVVKEFQLHRAAVTDVDGTANPTTESPTSPKDTHVKLIPTHDMLLDIVHFIRRALELPIPNAHRRLLSQHSPNDEDRHSLKVQSSLQALTNLAFLLDERLIPFESVSFLLRAMYHCPRVGYPAWVIEKYTQDLATDNEKDLQGAPKKVIAYTYLHTILKRLISNPPQHHYSRSSSSLVPKLNINACNTLLHYSLRHLASPPLAKSVLNYMAGPAAADTDGGEDNRLRWMIKPDETTYIILVRSGTLLRNDEVVKLALEGLEKEVLGKQLDRKTKRKNTKAPHPPPPPTVPFPLRPSIDHLALPRPAHTVPSPGSPSPSPTITATIHRLLTLDHSLPNSRSEQSKLLHVLTTLFMQHISTGNPQMVYKLHYDLFPELRIPLYWGGRTRGGMRQRTGMRMRSRMRMRFRSRMPVLMTPEELVRRKRARRQMVVRAYKYGPRIFTVILTALLKSNQIGAAKAFWKFAKRAEKMSWLRCYITGRREGEGDDGAGGGGGGVVGKLKKRVGGWDPWVLDECAYTVMLQVLRAEWKSPLLGEKAVATTEQDTATLSHTAAAIQRISLQRGIYLYRSMKAVRGQVEEVLVGRGKKIVKAVVRRGDVDDILETMRFPVVDARALTAAIELLVVPMLVGNDEGDYSGKKSNNNGLGDSYRNKKPKLNDIKMELREVVRRYARTGEVVERGWTPFVEEIGEDLVHGGFDVPIGLRKLFVGRSEGVISTSEGGKEPSTRRLLHPHPPVLPYVFPDATPGHQPLIVPSVRTRGLPVDEMGIVGQKRREAFKENGERRRRPGKRERVRMRRIGVWPPEEKVLGANG